MQFRLKLALFLTLCISCTPKVPKIEFDTEIPQLAFAVTELRKVISESDIQAIKIKIEEGVSQTGGYVIRVDGHKVTVKSRDANGLMYGVLEVAEQVQLNGKITNTKQNPYIKKRGIKLNIPLDARTPSYDDTGDAAQKNYATMWDWSFWEGYLDQLAKYRYNVLTLWNPHPFPSMIKLENFPDVALNDVCVTTLKPTGKENEWAEPQMVSKNVIANLKTIKTISIDDKIAFWQKVMQRAHDRGIEIYFFNWNMCPNGTAKPVDPFYRTYHISLWDEAPGKNGISNQMDNPINVQYYREAVKTFLQTYPYVKGIGVTAGEHMMNEAGNYTRESWIWETYGKGILDAKKDDPKRNVRFIHRVWNTNLDKIFKYWKAYPDTFEASFKYACARLYSTPTPSFADQHIIAMKKYGLKSWWNLRNDDIYVHRWGNPEYVKEYINHFDYEHTVGFYMGSDGYVWGRDFISKSPRVHGQLELKKHWYKFLSWGRLAYNNRLDTEFFIKQIAQHYPETHPEKLYEVWKIASEIIPLVNRFHWNNWDYQWSVEACLDQRNGFHDVLRFMENPTLKGSGMINPKRYANVKRAGKEMNETTPYEVAQNLLELSEHTSLKAQELRNSTNSEELNLVLDDMQSMAALGSYYANKIKAATELALFKQFKSNQHKKNAIALLESSVHNWETYTGFFNKNYEPQMLARTRMFDCNLILEEVKKDVELAKNFE